MPLDSEIEEEMKARFSDASKYSVPRDEEQAAADKLRFENEVSDSGQRNQKLGLLYACLFKEDVSTASEIISLFPR